jgi:hypothetical protein
MHDFRHDVAAFVRFCIAASNQLCIVICATLISYSDMRYVNQLF